MASVCNDSSSLSNPLQVAVRHWHLDVEIDFVSKKLCGTVTVEVSVVEDEVATLVRTPSSKACTIAATDTMLGYVEKKHMAIPLPGNRFWIPEI